MTTPRHSLLFAIVLALFLVTSQTGAKTLEKKTVCVWDPVGLNGPVVSFFSELVPQAINWGLDIHFVAYDDENEVARDLESQSCDIGIMTAIRSRDFVRFAGTLDAIGGITSEQKLASTMATIASPRATALMSKNTYEVVASLPVGSMFAYVNDRSIRGIEDFRNKRIAVVNGDIQTRKFAELAGGIAIDESLSSFSEGFNNGRTDIVIMPALAYETFELYRGLGTQGGILDLRLFYGMLQAVSRKAAFDDEFGTNMRRYMLSRLNDALNLINKAEKSIPPYYWIRTPQATKDKLTHFYKDIRLELKVEELFDPKALSMLWKIRCHDSPDLEECTKP